MWAVRRLITIGLWWPTQYPDRRIYFSNTSKGVNHEISRYSVVRSPSIWLDGLRNAARHNCCG